MQHNYTLKPRYYRTVDKLVSEDERDISEAAMHRRSIGISLLEQYTPLPGRPQLMPSADATLKGVVLTIPAYAFTGHDNPIWNVYRDLLLNLPQTVTFYILAHEEIAEPLCNWLREQAILQRVALHAVPERYEMTIWAEDSFELAQDAHDNQIYLVQPHSHRRTADGNIGYQVANAFNWCQVKTPVYFEGGNMLVGDDFILLGIDHAIDTCQHLGHDLLTDSAALADKVAGLYCKYLDQKRKLYLVGCAMQLLAEQERTFTLNGDEWTEIIYPKNGEGTMQPIFHIDMFITLAGRNADGRYQLLVADTRAAVAQLEMPELQLVTPDAFDEIAGTLERLGFIVYRNPLPLVYVDDPERKVRKWYYASYNNALVEIKPDGAKTVWLPTYGHGTWQELEKTDAENKRIWGQLGFNVILLEDFHPFAENAGAAHCIKKYIREL